MGKENNLNILYCLADESSKPYEKGENPYPWTKEDEDFTNQLAREIESESVGTNA